MSRAADRVEITPARRQDLDAVAALELRSFVSPWRRSFFEGELSAQGRYATVAREPAGALAGYLFAMYFDDEMHVNKIAVDEAHRRKGIAIALMEDCFRFAHAHGIRTISLEVRQSNIAAQRFYEKLNFNSLYLRPRYYPDGESAVIMVLEV